MTILNPHHRISKYDKPYSIWVVDEFLNKDCIATLFCNWPPRHSLHWHHGHKSIDGKQNILEQGMRGISKINKMPTKIAEIIEYMHSQEFTDKIGEIVGMDNLIPDQAMRWSGLRTMLPNSFQLIHSDARISPESGLKKELTVLLYTQPAYWNAIHSGDLEIWNDEMTECVHKIEPEYNRAVIFRNTDTSFHGVPEVNFERRAITFSILSEEETSNRSKALFVARPQDPIEVAEEGVKRSIIEDKL